MNGPAILVDGSVLPQLGYPDGDLYLFRSDIADGVSVLSGNNIPRGMM
jgi:hypothetical protein